MVLYQSRHDATEYGRLAQLVEHLLDVQEVTGSSPVPSTIQFVLEPDSLRERVRVRFLFAGSPAARVRRAVNEQRQGITMKVVPCLLLCVSLYCAFQVNRCVRPYMVGTHVRRKNGKFLHIGVFFRLAVWYTRLRKWYRHTEIKRLKGAKDGFFGYACLCENLVDFPLYLCVFFAFRNSGNGQRWSK